jgi:hypothetical protein
MLQAKPADQLSVEKESAPLNQFLLKIHNETTINRDLFQYSFSGRSAAYKDFDKTVSSVYHLFKLRLNETCSQVISGICTCVCVAMGWGGGN